MASIRRDLLLVRHAKSAWGDPSLTDHDRPLAPRGEKAVRRLRQYLA
jgi:phosphohistidine phosphatase